MNPGYLKNTANKWINAFHIAYVNDNGTFNDYTVVITNIEDLEMEGAKNARTS